MPNHKQMHPQFKEMLRRMADPRMATLADTLMQTQPEVSVRLNPAKDGDSTDVARMAGASVPWYDSGRYLAERPRFTLDPQLHQGRYYVQDASSMVSTAVARHISALVSAENRQQQAPVQQEQISAQEQPGAAQPRPDDIQPDDIPLLWLDACAAPGGKSIAAIDGLPDGSLVVSNEYDRQRAEILRENLAKWGYEGSVVTRGDTAQYTALRDTFDVVAVDAPCSGEGMMRKDKTARTQWSPALVEECASRQKEILSNLWDTLRPGGFLVYSTCTFNTTENEEIVRWLTEEYGAEVLPLPWAPQEITGAAPGYDFPVLRFIPGRIRGEGLFMAILRKPGTLVPAILGPRPKAPKAAKASRKAKPDKAFKAPGESAASQPFTRAQAASLQALITPAPGDQLLPSAGADGGIRLFPEHWAPWLPLFLSRLQVMSAGIEAAEIKGHDLIPTQQLALSRRLNPQAAVTVETDRDTALDYLAREAVTMPEGTPRGHVLLTYGGRPLGFVKNLGNRVNNLYPKEWRIRCR